MGLDDTDTIIIGLGNPILGDDAVGLHVLRAVAERLELGEADTREASVGGMELVELMMGYRRAVLIDAIRTRGGEVGTVYRITPEDFKETAHASNLHNVSFTQALKVWGELGSAPLPEHIVIFAIEVEDPYSFREGMSPAVASAVTKAADMVLSEIRHAH